MSASNSNLDAEFDSACQAVKEFTSKPTDDELLGLYALYKQAVVGDVVCSRPNIFAVRERLKYDAWEALKGRLTQEQAKVKYIKFAAKLAKQYK